MVDWSAHELDAIGAADEIQITTARPDGSLRSYIPIWVVRVGDALYVRSYRGEAGGWYRHARRHPVGHIRTSGIEPDIEFTDPGGIAAEAVDQAYRRKYGGTGGYVNTMLRDDVAATTLRLTPR